MSVIFQGQITSDEIFKDFGEDLALSVTMEVTHGCNFRCIHCYGASERKLPDLTYSQFIGILKQLAAHGTLDLSLTGGEPLMRRDFLDLYRYARSLGMFVNVLTNASLLTSEHIETFLEYPVSQLSITMYGASSQTYQRMTGVKGAYEKVVKAVTLLKESGVPFELKAVATTITQHEIFQIRDFAEDLDVPFRYSTKLIPENNGCSVPLGCALSCKQAFWFDQNDDRKREAWRYAAASPDSDHAFRAGRRARGLKYLCHAGDRDVAISADGQLHLCLNERSSGYDLLTGNFEDGYRTFIVSARDEKAPECYACLTCPDIKYCDQCAAEIGLVGDYEYGTQPTCVLARMRHEWLEPKK